MRFEDRVIYLCPSDRAARAFQLLLARENFAPPSCIDFERFCADLWRRGQLFGLITDSRELLDPDAAAALWQSVIADESNLMAGESARVASLAQDAWTLAHRYGLSIRKVATLASGQDNQAFFARCAIRMEALLGRVDAITQPELCPQLLTRLTAIQSLLPRALVLTPSFTVHAGQRKLIAACSELGIEVTRWSPPTSPSATPSPNYHEFPDEQHEMRAAIAWAKSHADNAPARSQVVAIIVPNLSQSRAKWLTALREHLNPDEWRLNPEKDRLRFNLSIGETLATYPWVASLLTVLSAMVGSVGTEVLAQALMHPRWGRSPTSLQRIQGRLMRVLNRGLDQCTLQDWLDVLPPAMSAASGIASNAKRQSRELHRETLQTIVSALTEHPWIYQTDLFQLEESWTTGLRRWAAMDEWLPPVSWVRATSEISRMAAQQTFQPQSGAANIHVMGLLESAGVPLDAAWIVGFTDRALPEAYKPHPMLPRAWQAAEKVGLGSRDGVRLRADALWSNWNALCGELHVSYAAEVEGSAQRLSPLAAGTSVHKPTAPHPLMRPLPTIDSVAKSDESLPLAHSQSFRPPLTASLVEQQSHCPRKAAATRLNLREWPEHAVGIPARLRGQLVHDVMHAVGEVRIQETSDNGEEPTLGALRNVAARALELALQKAQQERPGTPAAVWAVERDRVLPLIDKVLTLDAARTGFAVVAVEQEVRAEVFGATFKLRVDRRDVQTVGASEDSGIGVVFDYKTGTVSRADWFSENSSGRLAAPQLPLYMLALHASQPASEPRIGALGYIVISDDDVKFVGVGADASLNPKKISAAEPAWPDLTGAWQGELGVLIEEHQSGIAHVAPLKGTATCRFCSFAGFCREPWSMSGAQDQSDDDDATVAGVQK